MSANTTDGKHAVMEAPTPLQFESVFDTLCEARWRRQILRLQMDVSAAAAEVRDLLRQQQLVNRNSNFVKESAERSNRSAVPRQKESRKELYWHTARYFATIKSSPENTSPETTLE